MSIDILDQPRGGILEATINHVYSVKEIPTDSLITLFSGSKDGQDYFKKNTLALLNDLNFIKMNSVVTIQNCKILDHWSQNGSEESDFSHFFKLEFLVKIRNSKESKIKYFFDALRLLFQETSLDKLSLENILRKSRVLNGIDVSSGEELSAKIDYCISLLRYFPFIYEYDSRLYPVIPNGIFETIIRLILKEMGKGSIRLFSELLNSIDNKIFPIFYTEEERILETVLLALDNVVEKNKFKLENVPDGGRVVTLRGIEYNAIYGGYNDI